MTFTQRLWRDMVGLFIGTLLALFFGTILHVLAAQ